MSNMTVYQHSPQPPHALISMDDMERMAIAIAKSELFGVKEPNKALALMLLAQAEGMHPATAARDFHIINGRPSMKAEIMMARFQADGGLVRWKEYSDIRACAVFSHPASPDPVTIEWTIETAKKAELLSNKMWQKYPRAMLRSRVVSEGIRTVRPGVLMGMYTDEEIRSFTPSDSHPVIDCQIDSQTEPPRDLDAELAECKSRDECKVWLAQARQYLGINKPDDPRYLDLQNKAAQRAREIKKPEYLPVQEAEEV